MLYQRMILYQILPVRYFWHNHSLQHFRYLALEIFLYISYHYYYYYFYYYYRKLIKNGIYIRVKLQKLRKPYRCVVSKIANRNNYQGSRFNSDDAMNYWRRNENRMLWLYFCTQKLFKIMHIKTFIDHQLAPIINMFYVE